MKNQKYKLVASFFLIAWQSRKNLFFIIFLIILVFPLISRAAGLVPCGGTGEDPCTLCYLFQMFQGIVNFFLFNIVPIVAVLMLVIGGFLFFFASGSPAALSKAKSTITSTVIGLIIIFTAWLIVNTFFVVIGVSDWTGFFDNPATPEKEGWFIINCTIPPPTP